MDSNGTSGNIQGVKTCQKKRIIHQQWRTQWLQSQCPQEGPTSHLCPAQSLSEHEHEEHHSLHLS